MELYYSEKVASLLSSCQGLSDYVNANLPPSTGIQKEIIAENEQAFRDMHANNVPKEMYNRINGIFLIIVSIMNVIEEHGSSKTGELYRAMLIPLNNSVKNATWLLTRLIYLAVERIHSKNELTHYLMDANKAPVTNSHINDKCNDCINGLKDYINSITCMVEISEFLFSNASSNFTEHSSSIQIGKLNIQDEFIKHSKYDSKIAKTSDLYESMPRERGKSKSPKKSLGLV